MIINYNNPDILYSGRFIEGDDYITSGWQGNLIRFTISGTHSLIFTCDIQSINDGLNCTICSNLDNAIETTQHHLSEMDEVFTGERSVTVPLPDNGLHSVIIKLRANGAATQFAGTAYVRLKTITVDDGAILSPYPVGSLRLMCLGDSWMSCIQDWPRLLDTSKYEVYPVAYGGAKAPDVLNAYPYQISGVPKTGDGKIDAAIIGFGVNDATYRVAIPDYKTYVDSLIDTVRADYPAIPICLLQAPRNKATSTCFEMYGTVLKELSEEKQNTQYISTTPVWNDLRWTEDNAHLRGASKQDFADFVSTKLQDFKI